MSGKTLEPNQRQIQYQNSSAKSEANSVPKFRCQIRGKSRTKIPLPNQRQIQYQNSVGKSEANSELNVSKPDLDIIPKNYRNFAERMSFICQFTKKIR